MGDKSLPITNYRLSGVICLAFFLIVPSVIIVTIFLVHSAAERLGFRVKYFSLILCAVISLAVNVAAIKMSDYLDKWHYVKLGVLILVASLIVTLVNKYLIRHDKTDVVIIDEETTLKEAEEEEQFEKAELVKETEDDTSKSRVIKVTKEDTKADKIDDKEETSVKPKTPIKKNKPIEIKTADKLKENDKPIKTQTIFKPVEEKSTIKSILENKTDLKTKIESATDTKISTISTTKTPLKIENKVDDKINKTFDKPEINSTIKTNKIEKTDIKPIKTNEKSEIKKTNILDDKTDKKDTKPTAVKPKTPLISSNKITDKLKDKVNDTKSTETKAENKIIDDKMADINSHLGSLDDILDYAYSQKSKGNLNQAVIAYQKALDKYKNDDYAPFIAIDLGNIYKEQAAYSKVIKTYEEALKLPVVIRNISTRNEFNKNLNYMRMVQTVLVKHRALTTPFSKIPSQYLQEVEAELKSIQLNTTLSRRKF